MITIVFDDNRAIAYDGEKQIGECCFEVHENIWNIVHTEVDTSYQGQGIAKKLVECVVENAKKNNKDLQATCSYAKKRIEKDNQ